MLRNHSSPVTLQRLCYDIFCESGTGTQIMLPFPPNNKFYLYYFTPTEKPRIAAELRLRVTSIDQPASFKSGSDLLLRNGQPWTRPLYILPQSCKALYEKLREDGLVPDDLDAILSTVTPKLPNYSRNQYLYTLNDTFIVDFSYAESSFLIITETGMESLRFTTPFHEIRGGLKKLPYSGAFTSLDTPRLTVLMNL
jgi:hypothetical protein